MPEGSELSAHEWDVVIEALQDAMFFRDARSRVPKMSEDSKRRDRDKVAEYQALAVKLKQAGRP
jgi:hypothetical protein